MKKFVANEKTTLRDFTDNVYPQGSFCFNALIRRRDIRVNGVKIDKNVIINVGDEVIYYTTASEESKSAFSVLYSDENIIVCDKESGVNSEAVFSSLSLTEKECYFIHRLDRNTAGIIIFAKNKAAEGELLNIFKEHSLKKEYSALLFGRPKKSEDTITLYLAKDERSSRVFVCEKGRGAEAKTHYKVIRSGGDFSEVKITLLTGRTHQIRVTFAHMGCPVAGDEKYGDEKLNKRYSLKRQCLIASSLTLNSIGLLSYLSGREFSSKKVFRIAPFGN